MAVKIRLKRLGAKKRPIYRVVVANSTESRDGRFIETIGQYDPCATPPTVNIDADKALAWLSKGAQPTDVIHDLFRKQGILDRLEAAKKAARDARAESAAK